MKTKERLLIEEHYAKYLGDKISRYKPLDKNNDLPVDVEYIISRATRDCPYNVIATLGMSEYKNAGVYKYTELIMLLDEDWKLISPETRYNWPYTLLKKLANIPYLTKTEIKYGSYFINENNKPFDSSCEMCGAVVGLPINFDQRFFTLEINKRKTINFFLVTTATKNEISLLKKMGGINFIQSYLLSDGEDGLVVYSERSSKN